MDPTATKRYIEQAAYEKNHFSEDDLLIYYGHDVTWYGRVQKAQGSDVIFKDLQGVTQVAHYKACRLLIEAELKKVWIKDLEAFSHGRGVMNQKPDDSENWTQFIEIVDEDSLSYIE